MRVMVIVPGNKDSEAGVLPSKELFTEMGKFNEELKKAGVMLMGEGLHPTSKGVRVKFSEKKPTGHRRAIHRVQGAGCRLLVVAGEVHGRGHQLAEARSVWRRSRDRDSPVFETEDFGENLTPELKAKEEHFYRPAF